jgi:hypothetical protein
MDKNELLQMTTKEIEKILNNNITNLNVQSSDDSVIKGIMINRVKPLFDDTVKISVPYYTNRVFAIAIDKLFITFNVGAKTTGETVDVSRLRKKDVKTVGKFKFSDITMGFHNPYFDEDDLDKFTVKASKFTCTGGASISLKHRKEKLIDMLTRDILTEEIQRQDKDWSDIRKTVVLSASQPKIKEGYFKPNFAQKDWDFILQKTEEVNKELIDSEIDKMFII